MFLAISFGGIWLVRSNQRRSQKVIAAAGIAVGLFAWMSVMVHANAGPPGYVTWQHLAENLSKGTPTRDGLDIEVVPDDIDIKLIMPVRNTKPSGEE